MSVGSKAKFGVRVRACRIDSGNRVLDSKVGNRNRIQELPIPIPVKELFYTKNALILHQKNVFFFKFNL